MINRSDSPRRRVQFGSRNIVADPVAASPVCRQPQRKSLVTVGGRSHRQDLPFLSTFENGGFRAAGKYSEGHQRVSW